MNLFYSLIINIFLRTHGQPGSFVLYAVYVVYCLMVTTLEIAIVLLDYAENHYKSIGIHWTWFKRSQQTRHVKSMPI